MTVVERVEVLVEEPSTAEALRLLLPKIVGQLSFEIHAHQGKHDLLAALPSRLRGYAHWIPQNWRIVVVVDRDDDDCRKLKARLARISRNAGLKTRTGAKGAPWVVVNRLAIEELEAWYFGDWDAVRAAYPRVASTVPAPRTSNEVDGLKSRSYRPRLIGPADATASPPRFYGVTGDGSSRFSSSRLLSGAKRDSGVSLTAR